MSEEKLTIKVAQIDGIKIDNVDLSETRKDEIFKKLASDPASSYQQNASLKRKAVNFTSRWTRLVPREEKWSSGIRQLTGCETE